MDEEQFQTAITLLRQADYVVALTGAGISTPSGVPDFRSPHSGLWEHVDQMEVASIYGFRHNPALFYNWIRPLAHTILDAAPNPAHFALAQIEAAGKIKCVITQNIDMLHTRAGSRQVYEVHGHLREATCLNCFRVYPAQEYIQKFLEENILPHCPTCGGILKPNVILFGEPLPEQEILAARREASRCDVMLIAGSSLQVTPVADLPFLARRAGAALILVNLGETPADAYAQVVIHQNVVDVLPQFASALED
jgi:NAD-dependent deacetylase